VITQKFSDGIGRHRQQRSDVVSEDPRTGLTVRHRRYVPYSHAHYGGNLVDGAYVLALFGDVATEVCIRTDGDEGLFAGYDEVRFRAPVRAGDVIETTATVTRMGSRSRTLDFTAAVVCRAAPERGPSAAAALTEPIIAVTARGTVVVPAVTDQRSQHTGTPAEQAAAEHGTSPGNG
jgi:3-aminobutyryl-CoA ammonia-lyase